MAKIKSMFVCQECGYESPKWLGKCPDCNKWNTLVEEVRETKKEIKSKVNTIRVIDNMPKSIGQIKSGEKQRYDTGLKELKVED